MDIVTLGAALNGAKKQTENYVGSHFKGGSNIQITNNPDGTQTINASGEVSAEDTVARETISDHISDKANPHEVTAAQVGLGNVDNTADIDKPVSTAVSAALSDKVDKVTGKGLSTNDFTNAEKAKLDSHVADTNNPHQVTKAQVGLGNVDNVATKDVLAELVDSGAKNLLNITVSPTNFHASAVINESTGTVNVTSSGAWARSAFPITLPAGEYVFSVTVTLPSGTCRVQFNSMADGSGSGIGTPALNPSASGKYTANISLTETKSFFIMLYNNPSSDSDARTITYADLMICTKAAWDISQAYVPYRPNYDELVARIEALEQAAGINSVRSMANLTTETAADTTETEGGEVR